MSHLALVNGLDVQAFLINRVFNLPVLFQMFSLNLLALNNSLLSLNNDFLTMFVKHFRSLLVKAPLIFFVLLKAGHKLMEMGTLFELCLLQLCILNRKKTFACLFMKSLLFDLTLL